MITKEKFHGGCYHFSGTSHNAEAGYRVFLFTAVSGSTTLTIPTAKAFLIGQDQLVVGNVGSNAFAVRDNAGGLLLASLTANQFLFLWCMDNTTRAGTWLQEIRTRKT